jgi:hypothetical protein
MTGANAATGSPLVAFENQTEVNNRLTRMNQGPVTTVHVLGQVEDKIVVGEVAIKKLDPNRAISLGYRH